MRRQSRCGGAQRWQMRSYAPADEAAVLDLVNADRLPGQPPATAGMLAEAMVDTGGWAAPETQVTEVAVDAQGELRGVVSYVARTDGDGLILWMHCREDAEVAALLVRRAVERLGERAVHGFVFASKLGLSLEALPVRHRPATRRALEEAGFVGRDGWRYLHAPLPLGGLPRAAHCVVADIEDLPGKRLEVRSGGELLAEAVIGCPVAGVGLLWWISVAPAARRRGLGLGLLGSALDLLVGLGAREVILVVEDDAPLGDPELDRSAANRMYHRAGLREVDRLWSFTRPGREADVTDTPVG